MSRKSKDAKHYRVVCEEPCLLCKQPVGEGCLNYKRQPKQPCWWWQASGEPTPDSPAGPGLVQGDLFAPRPARRKKGGAANG